MRSPQRGLVIGPDMQNIIRQVDYRGPLNKMFAVYILKLSLSPSPCYLVLNALVGIVIDARRPQDERMSLLLAD
jgi:hypothetical protein